ncbi:MAG: hypothetical protein ACO3K0_10835, partial [Steroidobacteraceae bacterium]
TFQDGQGPIARSIIQDIDLLNRCVTDSPQPFDCLWMLIVGSVQAIQKFTYYIKGRDKKP